MGREQRYETTRTQPNADMGRINGHYKSLNIDTQNIDDHEQGYLNMMPATM